MRLSEFLAARGSTATAFAAQVGVAHTTVLRWADGRLFPSRGSMQRIMAATRGVVTAQDFFAEREHAAAPRAPADRRAKAELPNLLALFGTGPFSRLDNFDEVVLREPAVHPADPLDW
jgi:DNA-binding transcriptional regulator YdaS (Cro superfamily)